MPGHGRTPPPPCASTALSKHRVVRTVISCRWDTWGDGHRRIMAKHRVGVETLFLGNFGTTVFVVPDVRWGLKPFYHTLQPVILSQSRYSPSTACHHLHLLEMGGHVRLPSCVSHASIVLSKHPVGVEPLFSLLFGTTAVLAQGEGGYIQLEPLSYKAFGYLAYSL